MLTRAPVRIGLVLALAAGAAAAAWLARSGGGALPRPIVIPAPVRLEQGNGSYRLRGSTAIVATGAARPVGRYLHELLAPSTGLPLPVTSTGSGVALRLDAGAATGTEGYVLDATRQGVTIEARTPAGLFHGVQTLRQLLPPTVEVAGGSRGPWRIPTVHVVDRPRFAWRGAQLDVARHFFPVAAVERFVDLLALYKLNVLHLHLSDDQGWRIAIRSWPALTRVGGSTEVGGGRGGFYTQAQYRAIVAYAAARFVTVVPEIEAPGHVQAALASYPELACGAKRPTLYTGTQVGFSSLCVARPVTRRFYEDVVRELAALTPGPYIHVGGDEAHSTRPAAYAAFLRDAQRIVTAQGKTLVGWVPAIETARLRPGAVGEYWRPAAGIARGTETARAAVAQGMQLVMAPANRAYLDQRYGRSTRLGAKWAGPISVRQAYTWDPARFVRGVREKDVLGVEAPLWSDTLHSVRDMDVMALPRLPGIAEIGWSSRVGRRWREYRLRLAAQAMRWRALGLAFYHAPAVPWR